MIDLDQQRRIGIRQAKRTLGKIKRRHKLGIVHPNDQQTMLRAETSLRRWQRFTRRGGKL